MIPTLRPSETIMPTPASTGRFSLIARVHALKGALLEALDERYTLTPVEFDAIRAKIATLESVLTVILRARSEDTRNPPMARHLRATLEETPL